MKKMIMRLLSIALVLALLMSNFPVAVFAAETDEVHEYHEEHVAETEVATEPTATPETESTQPADEAMISAEAAMAAKSELEATIEQQIRAFAKSIDKPGADDAAATDLAMHGMFQGGKKLSAGKSHALTATLLNAEMMLACLSEACTSAIEAMQQLDRTKLENIVGYGIWKGAKDSRYGMSLYDSADKATRKLDWRLASGTGYVSSSNGYDDSLEWIVGTTELTMEIRQSKVAADTVTYSVSVTFKDRFDFSLSSNSMFKDLISGFGALLFQEFDWESKVSFELTVPYSCNHSSGMYRWTYDAQNNIITSDTTDGWRANDVTRHTYEGSEGVISYYYELAETVRLRHDVPWVVEYDIQKPGTFLLAPLRGENTSSPSLKNHGRSYLFVCDKKRVVLSDEIMEDYGLSSASQIVRHYYGTKLSGAFSYSTSKLYTFRLENQVNTDGSNMIYLTVREADTGTVCVDWVPMNDYYKYEAWIKEINLQNEDNNWVSGKDLYINYIGNTIYRFSAGQFELRIWENGEDGEPVSYYRDKVVKPTCSARGYTAHTCSACGYSYNTDYVNALPHKFGQYVSDKNATCTEDGTKTAKCSSCSATDTVADVGSAAGHSFDHGSCTVCGEKDPDYASGDFTGDGRVTNEDVTYLLWHTLFPADFPVDGGADLTGDGRVTNEDVTYLLWHTLFPGDFPLPT